MSTSPSWFDQEKFSRLVKKVAPKAVTEPLPSPQAINAGEPGAENPNPASTSRISLVSKPPSLLSENRALPALPRRTSPLPSLKPVFNFPTGPVLKSAPVIEPDPEPTADAPDIHDIGEDHDHEPVAVSEPMNEEEESALAETWHKMGLLNEELARAIHERDQALNESSLLREQLRKANEIAAKRDTAPLPAGEVAKTLKERDAAIAELQVLKNQVARKQEAAKDLRSSTQTQELQLLTEERDQARKQYFAIRKDYEELKQVAGKPEPANPTVDFEKEMSELRLELAERDSEIAALKAATTAPRKSGPLSVAGGIDEKTKEELLSLREQLSRAKDEASIAQRGLALSQKALHETRDTLREATEGTSLSRHNFDNLKNECATLSQQNAVLQTKNDQLMKDLAAAKKGSGRLGM